jgi:hypothetical protein
METANGSPITSRRSCPQWQAASRVAIAAEPSQSQSARDASGWSVTFPETGPDEPQAEECGRRLLARPERVESVTTEARKTRSTARRRKLASAREEHVEASEPEHLDVKKSHAIVEPAWARKN